eukprot:TRINITY_DN1133_c0_g1_i10.p1 TRINITY_DN1133_c0_g1~~TRINITY_DN1133_c0_g1_i10.p1  ORF type:complete len:256 (-),score=33.40 TRINITY_DN1133_c0_g1_i10:208-975(-)
MPHDYARLFVGNLPHRCTVADIEDFFRGYGKISAVTLKTTKYAFVDFCHYEDADRAVKELDGKKLNGNRIPVEHGKGIRSSEQGKRAVWTTKYGIPSRTKYRLKVENLSSSIAWQDLKDIMRTRGEVTYAEAHKEKLREGLVEFTTKEDMNRALHRLQNHKINGRRIKLTSQYQPSSRSRSKQVERSRSRSKDAERGHGQDQRMPRGHGQDQRISEGQDLDQRMSKGHGRDQRMLKGHGRGQEVVAVTLISDCFQ